MASSLKVPKMYKLFIGGKFVRTESERYLAAVNPKTKQKICNFSTCVKEGPQDDAGGRAGDDRGLAPQLLHFVLPRVSRPATVE